MTLLTPGALKSNALPVMMVLVIKARRKACCLWSRCLFASEIDVYSLTLFVTIDHLKVSYEHNVQIAARLEEFPGVKEII